MSVGIAIIRNTICALNLKEIGSTINGGFADISFIPKPVFEIGGIVPVLDNVTNEEGSLIEPLACCLNSINQIKNLEFDSVIILGDGPIGLMQLMLIKRFFKVNVTLIGKIPHRVESAKKLGADLAILVDDADDFTLDGYKKIIKTLTVNFHQM